MPTEPLFLDHIIQKYGSIDEPNGRKYYLELWELIQRHTAKNSTGLRKVMPSIPMRKKKQINNYVQEVKAYEQNPSKYFGLIAEVVAHNGAGVSCQISFSNMIHQAMCIRGIVDEGTKVKIVDYDLNSFMVIPHE